MRKHIVPLLIVSLIVIASVALSGGCESLPETQATVQRLKDDVAVLRAQATTMPVDSPERKLIESNTAKAEKALATSEAILRTIETGDTTGLGEATKSVPYAGLAIALGTILLRELRLRKVSRALEQTVKGIDAAAPVKSPELKTALATSQDVETKKLVAEIRAEDPK